MTSHLNLNRARKPGLQKKTRGGYRPGAGRKPSGRTMLSMRMDDRVIAALRQHVESTGQTQIDVVEAALKKYLKI